MEICNCVGEEIDPTYKMWKKELFKYKYKVC